MTNDVHSKDRLRDAFVLYCGGMFKTGVYDGAKEFRFKQEIPETGTVNGDVGALHVLRRRRRGLGWVCVKTDGILLYVVYLRVKWTDD